MGPREAVRRCTQNIRNGLNGLEEFYLLLYRWMAHAGDEERFTSFLCFF
jgi:hypothetical protein